MEKVSAFWIAIVALIAVLWIALTLAEEPPKEIRPEVTPIPQTVEIGEVEGVTPEVEIKEVIDHEKVDLLARLIQSEGADSWVEDKTMYAIGSVVINRVNDPRFPDTLEKVIYQPGQYQNAERLSKVVPTERAKKAALDLLLEGPTIPTDVVWQANFPQGKTYEVMQGVYFGR